MRTRASLALAVLLAGLASAPARAQRAVAVRADNDAFNFWQAPWSRPDEEYTSGVRLTVDYDGVAAWARRLQRAPSDCGGAGPCASHEYAVGQDIYTAARAWNSGVPFANGRPDAGLLWLSATSRVARTNALTEIGWTVGTTGKPSLAEPMQHFFHSLAPSYNRPITWGRQIPAEPVFAVSLDERRFAGRESLELQPHAGATVGTLLTEARAGLGMRLGTRRSRPWMMAPESGPWELALVGDATMRAVARNEVLDGAFFRRGVSVASRPFVPEVQAGVRARWRFLEIAWLAHQTGAEYELRRTSHAWSTLEAVWRPHR